MRVEWLVVNLTMKLIAQLPQAPDCEFQFSSLLLFFLMSLNSSNFTCTTDEIDRTAPSALL